jgi:hypothetical protein
LRGNNRENKSPQELTQSRLLNSKRRGKKEREQQINKHIGKNRHMGKNSILKGKEREIVTREKQSYWKE